MDLLAGCLNSPALTIQRFNQSLGEARIPVTRCEPSMSLIPFAPFILSGAFLLPSCFLLFLRSALKLKSKRLSLVRISDAWEKAPRDKYGITTTA